MQNVPKIVRDRLQPATPAVNHPDADVLTAFAERSLPERERALVFEHMARCTECRDVLALALPVTEPVQAVVSPSPRSWVAWPALRWAFVAAGVIALASFGMLEHQRHTRAATMAYNSTLPQAAPTEADKQSPAPASSPATASSAEHYNAARSIAGAKDKGSPDAGATDSLVATNATPSETRRTTSAQTQQESGMTRNSRSAPGGAVLQSALPHGPLPHGPRLANQWQQQNQQQNTIQMQNQVVSVAAPTEAEKKQSTANEKGKMQIPAATEMVEVSGESSVINTEIANVETPLNNRNVVDLSQLKPPSPAPQASEDYALARAKPATPAQSAQAAAATINVSAAPSSGVVGGATLASSAPAPRWTITSNGMLQRSFDQGATWQAIDVEAPRYFTDATGVEISGKPMQRKVRKMASPTFRAVAATGTDVWAGGSGAILYHSLDAGDHWARVMPASSGSTLTGDIVSLEFLDPQHGKVSTSTAEIWTTADDGQTWQKQ